MEHFEGSLVLGLSDRTGFLKEIRLDVVTGIVARSVEVDSDELAVPKTIRRKNLNI